MGNIATALQARHGKDIQGIPWERLHFTRESYRETRLQQSDTNASAVTSTSTRTAFVLTLSFIIPLIRNIGSCSGKKNETYPNVHARSVEKRFQDLYIMPALSSVTCTTMRYRIKHPWHRHYLQLLDTPRMSKLPVCDFFFHVPCARLSLLLLQEIIFQILIWV
jgi:hypothetical protein